MALIAKDISETKTYSLVSDSGNDKTIFTIGQLDIATRAFIDDTHTIYKDGSLDTDAISHKYIQFCKFGLKGWSNFKDKNGKEVTIEFTGEDFPRLGNRIVVSDASLNLLGLEAIIEIGIQVVTANKVEEAQRKNS